jgi:hypothetical protein
MAGADGEPAKWQIFAGPGILGQLEADLPQQQDGLRVADLFGPPMGPRSGRIAPMTR